MTRWERQLCVVVRNKTRKKKKKTGERGEEDLIGLLFYHVLFFYPPAPGNKKKRERETDRKKKVCSPGMERERAEQEGVVFMKTLAFNSGANIRPLWGIVVGSSS